MTILKVPDMFWKGRLVQSGNLIEKPPSRCIGMSFRLLSVLGTAPRSPLFLLALPSTLCQSHQSNQTPNLVNMPRETLRV